MIRFRARTPNWANWCRTLPGDGYPDRSLCPSIDALNDCAFCSKRFPLACQARARAAGRVQFGVAPLWGHGGRVVVDRVRRLGSLHVVGVVVFLRPYDHERERLVESHLRERHPDRAREFKSRTRGVGPGSNANPRPEPQGKTAGIFGGGFSRLKTWFLLLFRVSPGSAILAGTSPPLRGSFRSILG